MARPIAGEVKGGPYQGTHTRGDWASDNAVDIYAPEGTPVYATTFGRIDPGRYGALSSSEPALAGLRLHLLSDTGSQDFYYAHLSKIVVQPGSKVKPGQLIGYSGSANGVAHLHFAVQKGSPYDYLKGKAPKETVGRNPPPAGSEPPSPAVVAPTPEAPPATAQPSLVPPPLSPLTPPGGGLPAAGVEMPGSQVYTLDRRQVAQNWQRLASTAPASAQIQQWAQLASLGLEDDE